MRDEQFYTKISKCVLVKKSITYLRHLITERGVEIDPSRIKKVKLWPTLQNIQEVRSFLGVVNFLQNPNYPSFVCGAFQFPTPRAQVPIHNQTIVDWNKPETNENGQKLC